MKTTPTNVMGSQGTPAKIPESYSMPKSTKQTAHPAGTKSPKAAKGKWNH